ncbi:MAG: LuxR C-terminal-related transcriptional regulator, partial [Candidatus Cryptobacteroides sp.]
FTVPSSNNTICIYVSCSMPGSNDVQYRISGKDESWHNVLLGDCIQIPSLSFGKHSIEIRSASNHNAACSLPVKIQVPWYISWEMILVYGILIILMISGTRVYYKEKNRRIQEEEIKRLEYQNLLKEKKISEIEKEKLRNELKYKGKELANMALNNSRRKGMISGLIAKLEKISTYDDSDEIKQNASALIKQLDSQLKDESEWQKSEDYFNTIYDGLLDRLKASYPSLSKTDLKLCVYIKLNMSTKEIADLMNISPRSVEMGRYRLRKKLGLRPEDEISSILK